MMTQQQMPLFLENAELLLEDDSKTLLLVAHSHPIGHTYNFYVRDNGQLSRFLPEILDRRSYFDPIQFFGLINSLNKPEHRAFKYRYTKQLQDLRDKLEAYCADHEYPFE